LKFLSQMSIASKRLAERSDGNEYLRSDSITPAFYIDLGNAVETGIRERRLTEPDMRNFMYEREDLRGFGVRSVDEDHRERVRQTRANPRNS